MLVAATLEQIPLLRYETSSSRHQPSSPWTETDSSSKCKGSSLVSARGLRWWQVVAARVDFQSLAAAEATVDGDLARSIPAAATAGSENPKGFGVYL
jgi:hypothetical protein